jgi:two-component system sensor histidine kinase BaeS
MLSSLRNRLVFSHILPLIFIIPLMGVILVYGIERQILIPSLANELVGDGRLLSEASRTEYELWGNPYLFESMLFRVQLDPAVRVMFLNPQGELLYSSDPADQIHYGERLPLVGLEMAQAGQEVVLTNYSGMRLHNIRLDTLIPVISQEQKVIGIVRLTYQIASVYELFSQMRILVIGVLIFGLLAGAVLGLILALNIGKPVQQVTQAIYDLAWGTRQEPLKEQGVREIRAQVQAVNFLLERLHSLEQARRQLLANLVHELGRPLGALRSAIHALSQGAASDPQLLADLTNGMDEETGRLQHILDDLAHLHDQVLGALELDRKPLDLCEWLPKALLTWQPAAREKRLHWQVEIAQDLPTIRADPVRLEQVVGNLVSNAIKYTPSGRSVTVSAGRQDGEIWIRVSDTGPGIPMEEQKNIYTPFYRGDQGKRIKQGMGLGLTIARDLTAAHGGRIELESTPGLGSSFTVHIPIL